VRRPPLAALLAVAAAAGAAGAEEALFGAAEAGPGWSVVDEAPEDASADPDLRRWGVRERRARHYTREASGAIQVCSIEVWTFGQDAQARAAHAGFAYPEWRIEREGRVLVMLRGLVMARGRPPQRGVFPACGSLGERVRSRTRVGSP